MNDSYKTFRVSLRPPRIACLINLSDEEWQTKVLIAIESFSRTWGGAGFIIVPTDGKNISSVFWEILLAYDADYFWIAFQTDEDYEFPLVLSDELVAELKLRLAPFHHDDSFLTEQNKQRGFSQNLITEGGTYPNFKAKYPFTDTITILPNCEHSKTIAEVANLEGLMKVWGASTTGLTSSSYQEDLKEVGIENQPYDYSEKQSDLFDMVIKGVQRDLTVENAAFPFTFAKSHLGFYRSLEFQHWKEANLVIVGETLEDFCLYFCLSRMRSKVAWLPNSWLASNLDNNAPLKVYENNSIGYFARALRNLEWENRQDGKTHFMSVSLTPENLESIRELFKQTQTFNIANGLVLDQAEPNIDKESENLTKSIKFLLRYPFKVFELDNVDKIISKHFIGSNMAGFFEPPKPKNFSKIDRDHHWVSEFSVNKQSFPRHPLLGNEILKDSLIRHNNARVGKDSIAFVDAKTIFGSQDMDTWLRKPEIHLPTAFEIFELIFRKNGYRIEISDKGRFALTTVSKFGHLSTLANFLTTLKGKIFERYTISEKENPNDNGLFLKTDRRWYLNFQTFKTILRDDITVSTLIYYLLGISVLHRGLILKCQLCRNTDWFNINELSHEFQCKRCNLKQIYQMSHALNQLEPSWYYKLDEVVYQAMTHNSRVPILALNYLLEKATTFDYCPELELSSLSTDEQLELDICCIQDGKLTIGEAKIANCLGNRREENKTITKYFELSEKIGSSQVVFATACEEWSEKTIERITKRFTNSLTRIVFLTKKEIRST